MKLFQRLLSPRDAGISVQPPKHSHSGLQAKSPFAVASDDESDEGGEDATCVFAPVMSGGLDGVASGPAASRRTAMDMRGACTAAAAASEGGASTSSQSPSRPPRPGGEASSSGRPQPGSADGACSTSSNASDTRSSLDSLYIDMTVMHRGRTATIYRARDRQTHSPVVIKSFPKARLTPSKREAIAREARLLAAGAGHHVVVLKRQIETDDAVCLVMEACTGGTVIEAISNSGGRLSEQTAATKLAYPLLKALAHLHGLGIVHRDIKPEHLMLAPGQGLKVGDFHCAARPGQEKEALNHRCGSIEYMAPEMLSKPTAAEVFHMVLSYGMAEEDLPTYDNKVDVWSAGAVLYEALTGYQPFLADGAADMAVVIDTKQQARNAAGVPEFIAHHRLSADCEDFLMSALTWDASARPSAAQLLGHRWMQRYLPSGTLSNSPSRRRSREARKSGDAPDGGAERAHRGHLAAGSGVGGSSLHSVDDTGRRSSETSSENDAPAYKRAVTDMGGRESLPAASRLRTSLTSRLLGHKCL